MRNRLLRTAFFTALTAYCIFALLEYAVPGYVGYVFSPHLAGGFALVLGIAWAMVGTYPAESHRIFGRILAVVIGLVLFIILWKEGEMFGDFRLPLALAGLFLPWCSHWLFSQKHNEE